MAKYKDFRVLDVPIDVSRVGETKATLEHVSGIACKMYVLLEFPGNEEVSLDFIRNLMVEVSIRKGNDEHLKQVLRIPDEFPGWPSPWADSLVLERIDTVQLGIYAFQLDVLRSAPKLRDVPHRLVLRYQFCGLEQIALLFSYGIAGTFGCIALGLGAWLYFNRKGMRIVTTDSFSPASPVLP